MTKRTCFLAASLVIGLAVGLAFFSGRDRPVSVSSHPIMVAAAFADALYDEDRDRLRSLLHPDVKTDEDVERVLTEWGGRVPSSQADIVLEGRRHVVGKVETAVITSPHNNDFRLRLPLTVDTEGAWVVTSYPDEPWVADEAPAATSN